MKKANTYQSRSFLLGMLTMVLLLGLLIPAAAASANKTITVSNDLSIYVDGVEMKPTDASGKPVEVFLYNGTTYVPIRAVSQYLGKAVKWDGDTRRVYIGEAPGEKQYLLDVCPPYQTSGTYITPDFITMAGQKYTNGFTFEQGRDQFALFNLNGEYNTLSFDIGHRDGKDIGEGTLHIYLDNKLTFTADLHGEMLPKHYDVNLHGALQMKIVIGNYSDWFGLANITAQ